MLGTYKFEGNEDGPAMQDLHVQDIRYDDFSYRGGIIPRQRLLPQLHGVDVRGGPGERQRSALLRKNRST